MVAKLLTAAAVERIKPDPAKRLEIPDKLLPGLYLVVQPSGRRSFAVRTRVAGKPAKVTLTAMKLDEARDEARETLKAVQGGEDPRRKREAARLNTVAAVMDEYITRYAKPRQKSWRETEARLKRDLVRAYGDRPIGSLTRADIVRLLDELGDRGVKQAANRLLAHTRRFLGWAVERGLVEASAAAGIKPPAKEVQRDRILDDEELADVWRGAGEMAWPFGPLFRVMIATAQREGEVAGFRWADLDIERATWTLPREQTKADRLHVVPLNGPALAALREVPELAGSPFLFSTTGQSAPSGWSRAKARLDSLVAKMRAERRLGRPLGRDEKPTLNDAIPPWRLHDLRRTAASNMARLGHPPHVVSAVLNHAPAGSQGITAVYNRYRYDDEKRAALEAWGRHLERITSGKTADVVELRARG
jgi:integrase